MARVDWALADRVLILALFGADAALTERILRANGIASCICPNIEFLCAAIGEGAAAIILSEEALVSSAARELIQVLDAQPPWSDLPVLISSTERDPIFEGRGPLALLGARANITLLDRPVHVRTFVSTVKSALRSRHRQYNAREVLLQLSAREASEKIARGRAEEMSRAKDEFLATVSHELRTPLNAILGWARMLNEGVLDEAKQDRALQAIERNAVAQAQLIEDLLDVSRIISGKLRLDLADVDLQVVIEAAIDSVRPAMDAKQIQFQCTIDPTTTLMKGDPHRLQQVVWNLLLNAVKFTPAGGRVELVVARINAHIELRVSDSGHGIDPSFLPHIFERFQQADGTSTRAYGGLGLGLAICRHIVELHGGTIEAQSEGLSRGSTFIVNLPPLRRPGVAGKGAHPITASVALKYPVELRGLKVLVVDDEADARELLVTLLAQCDAITVEASSALGALDAMAWRPDVIVADIGMPVMDGYELLRRIRALPCGEGGRTPAAALTAYARVDDRREALKAGFEMFVPKPVEPSEFLVVVAELARIGRAMK